MHHFLINYFFLILRDVIKRDNLLLKNGSVSVFIPGSHYYNYSAVTNFVFEEQKQTKYYSYTYEQNGRLYDPVICRFFSPDNFVLDNTFTQDFNRYSYARNNPLKYIDPTGQYIVGTDGKPIQYTTYSNDSISWSSNTSADVQRVGNSMLQTNTGTEVFNNMIDAKHPISININKLEQTHSKLGDCFNSISDLSFNPNDIFFV